MIVISRNGTTTVYRGWRAWLMGAVAFLAAWLLLALVAFVVVGVAITAGLLLFLALPAMLAVVFLMGVLRPRGL